MSFRLAGKHLGLLFLVLSAIILLVAMWSGIVVLMGDQREATAAGALLISGVIGGLAGGVLWMAGRGDRGALQRREALLLVAASWAFGAALAGLPYLVWAYLAGEDFAGHAFLSPVNCYFESMSGLTTTGATVLTGIDMLPRSILLWRALTHWLGGLGIVVLFVAVLPAMGVGGKRLFQIEAPGPDPEGVHPQIRETARILWYIYVGLTIVQTVALRLAGMDWFQAACHTFATLATGGFSTVDASVGGFNSLAVDLIVIFFMVLAGVNFGLYYQLITRRIGSVWRDTELRVYLAFMFGGAAIVALCLIGQPLHLTTGEVTEPSVGQAVRHGFFTTISIQTTTGFGTADFNHWPTLAKIVLLALMFVGGSAGSTSGGVKVIRIWIAIKVMAAEIERIFRPNVVRPIRLAHASISPELKLATIAYVLGIVVLLAVGTSLIMLIEPADNIDITTASTSCLATLCTIGPGLAKVGAIENYGWLTNGSKLVLSLLMALGRLEVFAIIVLFQPRFWRGN